MTDYRQGPPEIAPLELLYVQVVEPHIACEAVSWKVLDPMAALKATPGDFLNPVGVLLLRVPLLYVRLAAK